MPPPIAVLDTCVLVPYLIRDTLLRAARARFYQARWSETILTELDRTLRDQPFHLTDEQIQHLFTNMQRAFPQAMVLGFEHLEDQLVIDQKDRHVLAAAIQAGAEWIVTDNIRHFPPAGLSGYGVRAQPPDAFLASFARQDPERVVRFLTRQAAVMKHPPTDVPGLLAQLERQAPAFVSEVRRRMPGPSTA